MLVLQPQEFDAPVVDPPDLGVRLPRPCFDERSNRGLTIIGTGTYGKPFEGSDRARLVPVTTMSLGSSDGLVLPRELRALDSDSCDNAHSHRSSACFSHPLHFLFQLLIILGNNARTPVAVSKVGMDRRHDDQGRPHSSTRRISHASDSGRTRATQPFRAQRCLR